MLFHRKRDGAERPRLLPALLCALLCLALAACGRELPGKDPAPSAAPAPTAAETPAPSDAETPAPTERGERSFEGFYEDGRGNILSVTRSGDGEGWYVRCALGGEFLDRVLQGEAPVLQGVLFRGDGSEFPVTLSLEGTDGLLLTLEGGESYRFTAAETPVTGFIVTIGTEGRGQVDYVPAGEEPGFEGGRTSLQLWLTEPETCVLAARPEFDWLFVGWTADGEELSTRPEITVELTGDVRIAAVFEPDEVSWLLRLVNSTHPLPEGFTVTLMELEDGHRIDERIYPDMQRMFDDALEAGYSLLVNEAFRTAEEQQTIMDNYIARYEASGMSHDDAVAEARKLVALPGTSEHQLGLALDIIDASGDSWDAWEWLLNNCQRYGFILRYPYNKTEVTGISHEPWHFRYVGVEAAEEIMGSGLALEEYLEAREAAEG